MLLLPTHEVVSRPVKLSEVDGPELAAAAALCSPSFIQEECSELVDTSTKVQAPFVVNECALKPIYPRSSLRAGGGVRGNGTNGGTGNAGNGNGGNDEDERRRRQMHNEILDLQGNCLPCCKSRILGIENRHQNRTARVIVTTHKDTRQTARERNEAEVAVSPTLGRLRGAREADYIFKANRGMSHDVRPGQNVHVELPEGKLAVVTVLFKVDDTEYFYVAGLQQPVKVTVRYYAILETDLEVHDLEPMMVKARLENDKLLISHYERTASQVEQHPATSAAAATPPALASAASSSAPSPLPRPARVSPRRTATH